MPRRKQRSLLPLLCPTQIADVAASPSFVPAMGTDEADADMAVGLKLGRYLTRPASSPR